ncbi:MAG: hypothetical protein CVV47_00785 [Spirochaetae bacterium HGW-Spirochaetae-3]|nr:MAG: hypothetical protein CVV47_00785 [Spirochaetae bacterium HGW-Spirochaetae-3]
MSTYHRKAWVREFVIGPAIALSLAACGLVDLRPVIMTVTPGTADAVLGARDAGLSVSFSAEPVRLDAERAFSVRSAVGTIEGIYSWEGHAFSWVPILPWDPGVRYRLEISEPIPMLDGREAHPDFVVPFYCLRSSGRPVLDSFSPVDGATVGVPVSGESMLELRFSESMDASSVRDALSLRPSASFCVSWNAEGTVAIVVPDGRLLPCTVYRWSLDASARAADGSPLSRSETAAFVTDLDVIPPRVARVYPAVLSDGTWLEAASSLYELDSGHSIAVLFSEAVDAASVRAGIQVGPDVAGRVAVVSQRMAIFTPDSGWKPEAELELFVSADVEDVSGLGMSDEYRLVFTPVVPFLRIVEVAASVGESTGDTGGTSIMAVTVGTEPDGVLGLTLVFSAPFGACAKVGAVDMISLATFFPGSLDAPGLRSAAWFSDDTLVMTWEGLRKSTAVSTNYYELTVDGGPWGITSESGRYLREDAAIYIEAKE